jgi:hypothetical protein
MLTFIFHDWWCSTRVMSIAVSFIFILPFLSFYLHATISNFHSTFSILNNVISSNDNKFIYYAWLGLCEAMIKCPFPFAHGTFKRFGTYIGWKKSKTVRCDMQYWMTFTPSCTRPLNQMKALKPSWLVGKTKSLKASPNIYSVIHGPYYFQVGTWINSEYIIVVPPCCAYPKIFTPLIKVEMLMMDLIIPCGGKMQYPH